MITVRFIGKQFVHICSSLLVLAGLDLDLGRNFKANIQGTFVSSTALTIGVSYCF